MPHLNFYFSFVQTGTSHYEGVAGGKREPRSATPRSRWRKGSSRQPLRRLEISPDSSPERGWVTHTASTSAAREARLGHTLRHQESRRSRFSCHLATPAPEIVGFQPLRGGGRTASLRLQPVGATSAGLWTKPSWRHPVHPVVLPTPRPGTSHSLGNLWRKENYVTAGLAAGQVRPGAHAAGPQGRGRAVVLASSSFHSTRHTEEAEAGGEEAHEPWARWRQEEVGSCSPPREVLPRPSLGESPSQSAALPVPAHSVPSPARELALGLQRKASRDKWLKQWLLRPLLVDRCGPSGTGAKLLLYAGALREMWLLVHLFQIRWWLQREAWPLVMWKSALNGANSKVDEEEMDNYMHFSQSFLEIKEGKGKMFIPVWNWTTNAVLITLLKRKC